MVSAIFTLQAMPDWYRNYKWPTKQFVYNTVVADEVCQLEYLLAGEIKSYALPQLAEDFANANHLGSDYVVTVTASTTPYSQTKALGGAVQLPTGVAVLVWGITIVVGGVVIYVVYKIIQKLDSVLTNTPHGTTNDSGIPGDLGKEITYFRLLSTTSKV